MGLIKALKDSVSTLMADQWREYFYCDTLPADVLMAKGQKRITEGRNSNTKGVDNIITNGSIVVVNEGQCMIIVDQGEIVEFCAEPGEFVYEASTEPSLFYGGLGEGVKKTFSNIGKRFTFGGNTAKDQRVYYFNLKENMDNLYGTANPIDFHLMSPYTGFHFDTVIRCNGEYTFKIIDPLLFYKNVCGNVVDEFTKSGEEGSKLLKMMKSELLTKLPMALAPIAAQGVLPYQLGLHTEEICQYLQQGLSEKWAQNRGIEVTSMTIAATVPDEARDALNEWNNTNMLTRADMQQAVKTDAFAEFMRNSRMGGGEGENGSQGTGGVDAMASMMALKMMGDMMGGNNNMMSGIMGGSQPQQAQQMGMAGMAGMQPQMNMQQGMQGMPMQNQAPVQTQAPVLGWTCSCGTADNRGKFCVDCGSPKPSEAGWTCGCGTVNQGKFCMNCGTKKPEGAPLYKCDKCGWEPEDPANPPKFCPECGDIFDDSDKK